MTCVRVCEGEREGEGVRMWVQGVRVTERGGKSSEREGQSKGFRNKNNHRVCVSIVAG